MSDENKLILKLLVAVTAQTEITNKIIKAVGLLTDKVEELETRLLNLTNPEE